MRLIPAIDLIDGRAVRLTEGDFAQSTIYQDDPVAQVRDFVVAGAPMIHVVDLDGARAGGPRQTTLIGRIVAATEAVPVQVGGGLRQTADLEAVFAAGASRAVVGSVAVSAPERVEGWIAQFGADRLVLAADIRLDGQGAAWLQTHGWQAGSGVALATVLDRFVAAGLTRVLVTDVGRDGTLAGPNVALYRSLLAGWPTIQLIASGGIASLDDLETLKEAGCAEAVIGRALYERRFTLPEALARVA